MTSSPISGAISETRNPRRSATVSRAGGKKGSSLRRTEEPTGHIYTLELPLPPSVNKMARSRRGRPLGNSSPNVVAWHKEADFSLWKQKPLPSIKGPFRAHIVWPVEQFGMFDVDNRLKALLDFLQSRKIIDNDRDCVGPNPEFGPEAKKGWCFIELWSVPDPRGK